MDFDGYHNLMDHRKNVHPSSKKCRHFSSGRCPHGLNCWYVHGEEQIESLDSYKCDLCDDKFTGRTNYMSHKKLVHPLSVPLCEKFNFNKCPKNSNECWFEHRVSKKKDNIEQSWANLVSDSSAQPKIPVFREVSGHALPPDQVMMMMQMVSKLCNKVDSMDQRFKAMGSQ